MNSKLIIIILIYVFNVQSANDIKIDFLKPLIGIFIIWFLYGQRVPIKDEQTNFFSVGLF